MPLFTYWILSNHFQSYICVLPNEKCENGYLLVIDVIIYIADYFILFKVVFSHWTSKKNLMLFHTSDYSVFWRTRTRLRSEKQKVVVLIHIDIKQVWSDKRNVTERLMSPRCQVNDQQLSDDWGSSSQHYPLLVALDYLHPRESVDHLIAFNTDRRPSLHRSCHVNVPTFSVSFLVLRTQSMS